MKAFSKKSSYLLIIMMIAALLLTGTVPSFAAKNKKTYTTPEGTVYPLEKTTILEGIPEVKGTSAIMIDGGSGRILYEKNAEEPRDPASITKIITCLLTLENMDLNDEVTITHDPVTTGQNIALKKGETLKVKDLLYALMLHSSNDAAEVLAIAVGGDFDTFAEMMNERAKECGAKNTTFHNPNGLNPDGQEHNWTTAYDISMMAREAMKNPNLPQAGDDDTSQDPGNESVERKKTEVDQSVPWCIRRHYRSEDRDQQDGRLLLLRQRETRQYGTDRCFPEFRRRSALYRCDQTAGLRFCQLPYVYG